MNHDRSSSMWQRFRCDEDSSQAAPALVIGLVFVLAWSLFSASPTQTRATTDTVPTTAARLAN